MLALICFVIALTSTVELGDKCIYPKGLPCKVYNTTQLDCSYRELTSIPPLDDHHVNSLDLSHNQIGALDATKFVHFGSVKLLDLSYNLLSTISEKSFVHLSSLEELDLSWNKISEATFNVTLPLRVLNLSFQILSTLDGTTWRVTEDTFLGLQKLEILNLSKVTATKFWKISPYPRRENFLEFSGSPFRTTPSLRALYLSGNGIKGLTSQTFSGLKRLEILEMSFSSTNMKRSLVEYQYESDYVNELSLDSFYNTTFDSTEFAPIKDISWYPESVFQDLYELRVLDLSYMQYRITTFPLDIFQSLGNLEHLNLSGLQSVNPLPPTLFNSLFRLRHLNLSNCHSYTVWHSFPKMTNLTNLEYLDISNNYLDSRLCKILEPLHSLSNLDISLTCHQVDMNVPCSLTLQNLTNLSYLTVSTTLCALDFKSETRWRDFVMALPISVSTLYLLIRKCDRFESWDSYGSGSEPSEAFTHTPETSTKLSRIYRKSVLDEADFKDSMKWKSRIKFLHIKSDVCHCYPYDPPIISIKDDVFVIFPYLTKLRISGFCDAAMGPIKIYMSAYAFRWLTHLQTLSINDNNLTRVPWDSLEALSHQLKSLDISKNRIKNTSWPRTNMTRLRLETLDLSKNPVSVLDLTMFGNDTLSKVYLRNMYPKNYFNLSTNSVLKTLFVSARRRAIFYADKICMYSPQLQSVSVVKFAFAIPTIFGASCQRLTSVYVSNAKLLYENHEIKILPFPRLEKLTITGCNMVSIRRIFLEVPSLQYLDLSKNNITSIDKYRFRFMKNLTYLNLSGNMLTNLQLPTDLLRLQILDISMNRLTIVPSILFKEPWHLQHLTVGNNSFDCTCEVEPLQSFILSDKITYVDPHLPFRCESVYGRMIGFNEFNLDCSLHLEIYVHIGVASLAFICMIVVVGTLAYKYRWLIRYKLFVLLHQRRYQRYLDNDDYADIINDEEEDNVDGEELAMRRRYHAYVAYHHDNEDWVDEQLIPNLEEGPEQFRLCLKARDLPANRRIFDLVCHGIYQSRKTIAVLSEKFMDDGLCDYQLHVARMRLTKDNDDVLILVQLGEIPDDKMTLLLRQILCHKKVMKWPEDPVGQDLFWGNLRVKLHKPVQVDRRFENV